EDIVGGAVLTRRATKNTRRGLRIAAAHLHQEIADEARLADAARAEEGDDARLSLLADGPQGVFELANLRRPSDEHGATVGRGEAAGSEAESVGHRGNRAWTLSKPGFVAGVTRHDA